ncbi:hypothetical protein FB451DRAFT_1182407 [Mycena latifolia]|nr:hypothetical protein FB451DRAFT_1182407 [Mycena latifolia]
MYVTRYDQITTYLSFAPTLIIIRPRDDYQPREPLSLTASLVHQADHPKSYNGRVKRCGRLRGGPTGSAPTNPQQRLGPARPSLKERSAALRLRAAAFLHRILATDADATDTDFDPFWLSECWEVPAVMTVPDIGTKEDLGITVGRVANIPLPGKCQDDGSKPATCEIQAQPFTYALWAVCGGLYP